MKITHVLGHNSNWNVDSFLKHNIGDYFLITAFTHGYNFDSKPLLKNIRNHAMIDLQFYGKNKQIKSGKLNEFPFHTFNANKDEVTSVYFENSAKQAIDFQISKNFKNIIIPLFYENDRLADFIYAIKSLNKYIGSLKKGNHKFFMTLPFANHIIIDENKVEEILFACTDMDINFDGYFITCENKPEFRKKLTTEIKIFKNLSRVFKTLKNQDFETIYAYANWDSIIYLAQTNIDYITIGSYENLRNFDIKRYTENVSGGKSDGYYFSEKLLNMIRAADLTALSQYNLLDVIKNEKNIFSDIILKDGYSWNIHKPDVNKNYLLSINNLLLRISNIKDLNKRKNYVLSLIENANKSYNYLENKNIFLNNEGSNYHLNSWKTYLMNS